ncbi:hypothetical protein D3C71_1092190 [compost metagenome]
MNNRVMSDRVMINDGREEYCHNTEILNNLILGVNTMLKLTNSQDRFIVAGYRPSNDEKFRWAIKKQTFMNDRVVKELDLIVRVFIDKENAWGAYLQERQVEINIDEKKWDHLRDVDYDSVGAYQEPGRRKLKFSLKNEDELIKLFSLLS